MLAECPAKVEITVLGFSQGTATVEPLAGQARFRPAHLILWAGGFPDDMAPATATQLLHGLPLTLVIGTDDEYISLPKATKQQAQLQQLGRRPACSLFPAATR